MKVKYITGLERLQNGSKALTDTRQDFDPSMSAEQNRVTEPVLGQGRARPTPGCALNTSFAKVALSSKLFKNNS